MIIPSNLVRIMVATRPIDFRTGYNGLATLVSSHLHKDPFTGTLTAIADGHPQNRIDDLLPWNFKPSS